MLYFSFFFALATIFELLQFTVKEQMSKWVMGLFQHVSPQSIYHVDHC